MNDCTQEIKTIFNEFKYSGYSKWCEEKNAPNIFDPVENAKKRLNLTNRLSLDIGANVRTKSQPRRRFFE